MPLSLEQISELARAEGLESATALSLERAGDERLASWLEAGFEGEMSWMGTRRDQRLRPAEHFAPYRSVISFLAPYDQSPGPTDPSLGNIARYARGDDYHEVLKAKLFRVMDALRQEDPSLQMRALVDTAPILEKSIAARAGLGWQGKHSNIIREQDGSYFFLAELLIDRDFPQAKPAVDRCGICDDCIRACPSGAIVAPYVVDARLCISYLTIELRGVIPRELRGFIGNRIFGCDDCQEVCPWNRHARLDPLAEFLPRDGLTGRDLRHWLALSLDDWRLQFRHSAVKRTKYEGFRRNVAVALGNEASQSSLPAIESVFLDADETLQAHLIWALRKIGGEGAELLLKRYSVLDLAATVADEFLGELDQPLPAR